MRPAEAIEWVFDIDADPSTGCEGFDIVYAVALGNAWRITTNTCDQDQWHWADNSSVHSNPTDTNLVRIPIHSNLTRESIWWVGVGNLDGTGYDTSWTTFYTSTQWVDCAATPSPTPAAADGYWLAGLDGSMWAFGSADDLGHACRSGYGTGRITDFEALLVDPGVRDEPTWVALHADGEINVGSGRLIPPEAPQPWEVGAAAAVALMPLTSVDNHPSFDFWVVYDNGAVIPVTYSSMPWFGDLRTTTLNQPIIDAVATPDGQGYWLVGLDGGVFSFGSARFHGSMGGIPLNEPVVAMVPDPDGTGYWLVAADGGVFAFSAPFVGSIPGVLPPGATLNSPVVGMIPYGNGYLMLGSDGGVFNFSDRAFVGSLGGDPPLIPVVGVAAVPIP
ncbi:MAG: hypothetical protein GY929_10800 [Actinomycetia bacterium]|nr:hypothetical protein [Actinomycetes bacterium]